MGKYLVTDEKGMDKALEELRDKKILAFDTETNSLRARGKNKDFKVVSLIISSKDNSYYLPFNHKFYKYNINKDLFLKKFKGVFSDSSITLVGHGIDFDFHVLERLGIKCQRDNYFDTLIASRLINEEYENNLEKVLEKYLGITGLHKYNEVVGTVSKEKKKRAGLKSNNKATFDLVSIDKASIYGIEDTEHLIDLKEFLEKELKDKELYNIYKDLLVPKFTNVFLNIERRGIKIDKEELEIIDKDITKDINKTIIKMEEIIGYEINPDSPKQVAELLYNEYSSDSPCEICKDECQEKYECKEYRVWNKYGHKNPNIELRDNSFNFPVPDRTETGQPSSGKGSLKRFKHYKPKNSKQKQGLKFIELLLHYKKISKLKSSFVTGLREEIYDDGRVHPSLNTIAAKSGRASSDSPNIQQLPSQDEEDNYKIRRMFLADVGKKMAAFDYSNLEMRLLAHYSEDDKLLETFEKGLDSHGATAVNVLGLDCHPNEVKEKYPTERSIGKTLNFALMYGMSSHTLYYTLMDYGVNLEDKELQKKYGAYSGKDLANTIYNNYFKSYQGVKELIDSQIAYAKKYGYVKTLIGRKIWIPEIYSRDKGQVSYGERLATNGTVQGSASDIIMSAQVKLDENKKLKDLGVEQLLQVHDEVVFQIPKENLDESLPIIKREMENPFKRKIKMNLDLKVDWDIGNNYFEAK